MDQPAVTRSITLDAPVDRVWDALGDADGLAGWLASSPPAPTDGTGPLAPGTALDLDVDGTCRRLVVTTVDIGRSVGFVWLDLDRPDVSSRVELVISPTETTDDATTVTVTETLVPAPSGLAGAGRASLDAATLEIGTRWDDRLGALLGIATPAHVLL